MNNENDNAMQYDVTYAKPRKAQMTCENERCTYCAVAKVSECRR